MLQDLIGALPVLAIMIVGAAMLCMMGGEELRGGALWLVNISLAVLACYAVFGLGCVLWWGAKLLWTGFFG